MINYPHLATRLFNTPLAITPGKIEIIMAALADRFGLARIFRLGGESASLMDVDLFGGESKDYTPYDIIPGTGIAVISIVGTLVQKLGTMRPYSGMTGYDGIRACLSMALSDDSVRAIVLDIDSPGGEVAGCFDLVDDIYRSRGEKPIWAVLSESAYSAAYAIASAADYITVPRTGGTGSIGVIAAHVDMSQALTAAGLNVTLITHGDRKADGNEFNPLSQSAFDKIQSDVNSMGQLFINTVSRNRNISTAKVRSTQASTYLGAAGVEMGLADAVLSPDQAIRSLLSELGQ